MNDPIGVSGSIPMGTTEEKDSGAYADVMKAYDELSLAEADSELEEASEDSHKDFGKDSGDESSEALKVTEDKEPEQEKTSHKKRRTTHEIAEKVEPPADWEASDKEAFLKWPKEAQQAILKGAKKEQANRDRWINQQVQEKKRFDEKFKQVQGFADVVEEWMPRWGAAGKDKVAAAIELCAFADKCRTNIDQALEDLAAAGGRQITIHNAAKPKNSVASPSYLSEDEIERRIEQKYAQKQQELAFQSQYSAVETESTSVMNDLMSEMNSDGQYLRPDLHSKEFHAEIQPIASALAEKARLQKVPITRDLIKDILTKSYTAAGGRTLPRKALPNATPTNGQNRTIYARRAASSTPSSLGVSSDTFFDPMKGERTEDQVRRIWESLNSR